MTLLYSNPLSPSARAIDIAALEAGIDCERRIEPDWERRRDFLALAPEGRVPVLAIPGQGAVCGALPIADYWQETVPDAPLITGTALQKAEIRRLGLWFLVKFDEEVARPLSDEKVLKRLIQRDTPDTHVLRAGLHNLRIHLGYVDYLADRRHYLAGDRFSFADMAAAGALSLIDYLGDLPWASYPVAKDWYMRVKSRRSVRAVLAERIPGLKPPPHYAEPDF